MAVSLKIFPVKEDGPVCGVYVNFFKHYIYIYLTKFSGVLQVSSSADAVSSLQNTPVQDVTSSTVPWLAIKEK